MNSKLNTFYIPGDFLNIKKDNAAPNKGQINLITVQMALATFTYNLNGGDAVSEDTALIFKIYGSADNYTNPITITGNSVNDANVSITSGVATISGIDVGSETSFKISSVDEVGNEGALSDSYTLSINQLFQNNLLYLEFEDSKDNRWKDSKTYKSYYADPAIFTQVLGKNGNALNLTSTATGQSMSKNVIDGFSGDVNFTFRTWFKSTDGGVFFGIDNNTNGTDFDVRLETSGAIQIRPGFADRFTSVETGFNDGNWHRLVFTYTIGGATTGMKMYVDGIELTKVSEPNATFVVDGDRVEFYNSDFSFPFDGDLDGYSIDTGVFTQQQITDDYNAGAGVFYDEKLHSGPYDIWLVVGHSQMDSYAPYNNANNVAALQDGKVDGVDSWNANAWIAKNYPLNVIEQYGDGRFKGGGMSGTLYDTFITSVPPSAVALHLLSQESGYNRPLLCQISRAGSVLATDWVAGNPSNLLGDLNTKFSTLITYLDGIPQSYNIKGCLVWLGENDAQVGGTAITNYQTNLQGMIDEIRTFTGVANLPIIIQPTPGDINPTYYSQTIIDATTAIVNGDANIYQIDNTGYSYVDGIHLDTPSVVTCGTRFKDLIVAQSI